MKGLPAWAGWPVLVAVAAVPAQATAQATQAPDAVEAAPAAITPTPAPDAPPPTQPVPQECFAERFVILHIDASLDAAQRPVLLNRRSTR